MRTALEFFDATVAAVAAGAEPPDPTRMLERLDGVPRDFPARPAVEPADDKLSIALVCREYPPETAWGGMATFTYHLAHGLADAGHRVAVITGGRPLVRQDHDGRVDVLQIEPRFGGARDSFEGLNRRGWLPYGPLVFFHGLGVVRAIAALEEAHGPFDVLDLADHAADGLSPALYCHGPTTVRLYSPWALLAGMGLYGDAVQEAALPLLESALLHRATLLTSPSEDLASRTMTLFGLHAPFAPVPNPVDAGHFRPAASPEDKVRVCFVGRLEERKGIHTLLAAIPAVLAASPEVEFEIVGPDQDDLAGTVAPVHRGNVRFRERVPLSELQLVYQRSSLAVVPSLYDNSPYTCIEPMACGIPVIGTSAGGTAEYVIDGETGIIVPARDHEALAEAILRLAGDAGLRERFGSAGRARVERHFELHAVAARMEAAYRLAIAGGGDPWVASWAVGPGLNVQRPGLNRVTALVLGGMDDGDLVSQTVRSAQGEGVEVLVVWDGPYPIGFEGARATGSSRHAGSDAARILPALLSECFLVLRAGDVLKAGSVDRARRALVESVDLAVAVDGVRLLCASAARGLQLADASSWDEVLDRVAARQRV